LARRIIFQRFDAVISATSKGILPVKVPLQQSPNFTFKDRYNLQ